MGNCVKCTAKDLDRMDQVVRDWNRIMVAPKKRLIVKRKFVLDAKF